jgi:spore coat protein A
MNIKLSRRQFLKGAAIAGVGMTLPLKFGVKSAHAFYQSPGLLKWQTTLRGVGPNQIPVVGLDAFAAPVTGVAHATINVNQFQDTLHPALGPTTLWGYHPNVPAFPGSQKHLGGIIVVNKGVPLQLTFRNNLPPMAIIPVDTTIPGANQAQNRTTVHLHGGLVPWISDGGPFDWWAPNGTHGLSFLNNQVLNPAAIGTNKGEYYYPNNQSARLVWYHDHAYGITRTNAYAGIASGYIIRDSAEGNMRNFGLPQFIEAGGREIPVIIQDKIFVGTNINNLDPTWVQKGLPSTLGSLWYPHVYEKNRWRLLGAGRNLPNPSVIAEMFGDTMLANGTVYPTVAVDPRRYRLRLLNACNARFLNLQLLVADPNNPDGITIAGGQATNDPGPNWLVLGTEAGFLKNPVIVPGKKAITFDPNTGNVLDYSLLTGNAERWDVIVDFNGFAGKDIILYSDAPAPFPGGDPRNDYYFGNPTNPVGPAAGFGPDTRQIMKFQVSTAVVQEGNLALVQNLNAPAPQNLNTPVAGPTIDPWNTSVNTGIDPFLANVDVNGNGDGSYTLNTALSRPPRVLTLNEIFDAYGRLTQMLGTDTQVSGRLGQPYANSPTETTNTGDVEIWEILNLTGDTHPIHFHLVNVQILNREDFNAATYVGGPYIPTPGTLRSPDPTEMGWKETVKMHPGTVTRVIMKFDVPQILKANNKVLPTPVSPRTGGNEYVWHCHILEHEEHDMMRPLVVT